jgi:hypothetical protein
MLNRLVVLLCVAALACAGALLRAGTLAAAQDAAPKAAVRVKDVQASAGRDVTVEIEMESAGDIAAIIFSLNWDPTAFSYVSSALAPGGPQSANLTVNSQPQQTSAGRLGVLIDSGDPFDKGRKTIMTVTFSVLPDAATRDYQFTFGSTPAMMSLSTVKAQLVDTKFTPGTARVKGSGKAQQPAASAPQQFVPGGRSITGRVLNELRYGIKHAQVIITGPDGNTKTAKTNSFGYFTFDNLPEGSYRINTKTKGYSFGPRTVEASTTPIEAEFMEAT